MGRATEAIARFRIFDTYENFAKNRYIGRSFSFSLLQAESAIENGSDSDPDGYLQLRKEAGYFLYLGIQAKNTSIREKTKKAYKRLPSI